MILAHTRRSFGASTLRLEGGRWGVLGGAAGGGTMTLAERRLVTEAAATEGDAVLSTSLDGPKRCVKER